MAVLFYQVLEYKRRCMFSILFHIHNILQHGMISRSSDPLIFVCMTTELMTLLFVYSVYGGNNIIYVHAGNGIEATIPPMAGLLKACQPCTDFSLMWERV